MFVFLKYEFDIKLQSNELKKNAPISRCKGLNNLDFVFTNFLFLEILLLLKGSDWLCKVVELSMQCCGKLLSDSFVAY